MKPSTAPAPSRSRSTPHSVASRWLLLVASVLALALAGCSSGSPAITDAPASPGASSGSSGIGDTIQLSAQGVRFSTNQLQAPAGRPFSIVFANDDSGVSHSVDILDASNASIFKGAIFAGVASRTYDVPAISSGTYRFVCDVHPNVMNGTLTVE